jgi:hypothetical protein
MSHKGNNERPGLKFVSSPDRLWLTQTKIAFSGYFPEMKKIIPVVILALFAQAVFGQSRTKTTDTAKNKPAGAASPFRMHYDDLFKKNPDGSTSPVQPLEINGEMVPTSTKLTNGVKYGGLDLLGNSGHDLLVDTLRGVVIIRKFLK